MKSGVILARGGEDFELPILLLGSGTRLAIRDGILGTKVLPLRLTREARVSHTPVKACKRG